MSEWQRCPVCVGTGLVSYPAGVAADQPTFVSASVGPWMCRRCEGSGTIIRPLIELNSVPPKGENTDV